MHCIIITTSFGPDIESFKHFQEIWSSLDTSPFSTAAEMPDVTHLKDEILQFAKEQLEQKQQSNDYKEFLQLAVIFLGGSPTRGMHIQAPGAIHRARWMARVLYCYKIWQRKETI